MVLDFFRSSGESTLDQVKAQLVQMLGDGRHIFDGAMAAVLGGIDPKTIKKDLKSTDRGINAMERAVRRDLVLHASVQTLGADTPAVLAYMSVVKDAERIGDYSKNVFDIRRYGADLSNAPDLDVLMHHRDRVSAFIGETARILTAEDADAAQQQINAADDLLDEYDELVKAQFLSEGPAADAVARALLYRYLKRIVAHLMNMLSMLVVPIDRLDYYDEDKDTRD